MQSGLVSRWADDEVLADKALKEDVSHNAEDPFKKVSGNKWKPSVTVPQRVEIRQEKEAEEEEDVDNDSTDEFKPLPKQMLSKETQRLFPVFDSESEDPNEPRRGSGRRRGTGGMRSRSPEEFRARENKRSTSREPNVEPVRLPKGPKGLKDPKGPKSHKQNGNAADKPLPRRNIPTGPAHSSGLPSRWADEVKVPAQLLTPPPSKGRKPSFTANDLMKGDKGRGPAKTERHFKRDGAPPVSKRGGKGGRGKGRKSFDKHDTKHVADLVPRKDTKLKQKAQPKPKSMEEFDFEKEIQKLAEKFDTKGSWVDDFDM